MWNHILSVALYMELGFGKLACGFFIPIIDGADRGNANLSPSGNIVSFWRTAQEKEFLTKYPFFTFD